MVTEKGKAPAAAVLGRQQCNLWRVASFGPLAHVIWVGVVIAGAAMVGGCLPRATGYLKIDAPEARHLERECNAGIGVPTVVYYAYHGVFISIDITDWVSFGVHVPVGNTVRLEGNRLRISGMSGQGPVDVSMPIWAVRQGDMGSIQPREFRGFPDPFTSRDYFGPLQGASRDGHYLWYLFAAESVQADGQVHLIPTPEGLQQGTVELPAMTINGQHYEPQVLHFERHVHPELSAINC